MHLQQVLQSNHIDANDLRVVFRFTLVMKLVYIYKFISLQIWQDFHVTWVGRPAAAQCKKQLTGLCDKLWRRPMSSGELKRAEENMEIILKSRFCTKETFSYAEVRTIHCKPNPNNYNTFFTNQLHIYQNFHKSISSNTTKYTITILAT